MAQSDLAMGCSIRNSCKDKGFEVNETRLAGLLRLVHRHVKNQVIANLFDRIPQAFEEGVSLQFLGDDVRRYLCLFDT